MFKELAGLRERYGVTGALYAFRLPVCKKFYLAVWLFARAAASGEYKPGMPVAEITAGNMGLALAEQCAKYRSPLYLVPIGRLSEEKRRALEEKGARLVDARPKEGEAYWMALERTLEEIVVSRGACSFRQFTNPRQLGFYRRLFSRLPVENVDCVIDKIGTGATLAALGERFPSAELLYATSLPAAVDMRRYRFFTREPKQIFPRDAAEYKAFGAALKETEGIENAEYGALSLYCGLQWLKDNPGKSVLVFIGD